VFIVSKLLFELVSLKAAKLCFRDDLAAQNELQNGTDVLLKEVINLYDAAIRRNAPTRRVSLSVPA
jgi:hypothetical protein